MADNNEARNQGMPTPDLALKRLNRLLGIWSMKGHRLVVSPHNHIQMAAEGR